MADSIHEVVQQQQSRLVFLAFSLPHSQEREPHQDSRFQCMGKEIGQLKKMISKLKSGGEGSNQPGERSGSRDKIDVRTLCQSRDSVISIEISRRKLRPTLSTCARQKSADHLRRLVHQHCTGWLRTRVTGVHTVTNDSSTRSPFRTAISSCTCMTYRRTCAAVVSSQRWNSVNLFNWPDESNVAFLHDKEMLAQVALPAHLSDDA